MSLYVSFECESCENDNCTGKGLKSTVYKCGGYKHKQTNADRIRAKTDEEPAWFYAKKIASCYGCEASTMEDCAKCWLDWLKQEVDT